MRTNPFKALQQLLGLQKKSLKKLPPEYREEQLMESLKYLSPRDRHAAIDLLAQQAAAAQNNQN